MTTSSNRMANIQPFHVMAILARAQELEAQGKDIIHLEIGEPDFPTAQPIVEAGIAALNSGKTFYTPALGLPALREKLAAYYQQRFQVSLNPNRIVITSGASGALLLLAAARLNPNDQLMLADPGYPCNRNFARLFEAHGQLIPTGAAENFQLTPDLINQHWQPTTKAALVASPANPTGTCLSLQDFSQLSEAIANKGGELWVDEIYQGLNYGAEAVSVLQVNPDAVVLNSFSKYFGMTGWRLGWTVVPESWVSDLDTLAQNIFLAASTPAQYAALAALEPASLEIFEERRQELAQRRDYLLAELPKLGFKITANPAGAFYIYADASAFTKNSLAWCAQVLEQTGVALTPGVDFGEHLANTHVRFAFTTNLARLEEAVERLRKYLG